MIRHDSFLALNVSSLVLRALRVPSFYPVNMNPFVSLALPLAVPLLLPLPL